MILRLQNYFKNVKPVTIDGLLYVIIAVCGFLATVLGGDEAYELFRHDLLFWLKLINGSALAGATSLKMFRSTQYAEHAEEKKQEQAGNTDFIAKPPTIPGVPIKG